LHVRSNIKNSFYPPDPPIMNDSSIGELHFQFVDQVSHQNPRKSRDWACYPQALHAGCRHCYSWGSVGRKTQTLITWNLSQRWFHIRPTIFSLHNSERSFPQWMLGNVVEKSEKATYVARLYCDTLYWISR